MDRFDAGLRLKQSIRGRQPTLGVFVKTPAVQVVELLSASGVDFLALDAEHAAFDDSQLDRCILAARAAGVPVLVRVREASTASVLAVLDMGAAGIIAPHVSSVEAARKLIAACRYRDGVRGFSNSTRAAGYGAVPAGQFTRASDESIVVIAQVEDVAAVREVAAIAALADLDALFIGRADLAVSLGAGSADDAAVSKAVAEVLAAGREHGKATGLFLAGVAELAEFDAAGATLFIVSSDQHLLRESAAAMAAEFRTATGEARG